MPWLLAAFSGLLLTLSFPPFSCWPLAWCALVPLFWAVRRCPDAKTAAPALLQSCALVGLYGLSGVIAAVNAALALSLENRPRPALAAAACVLLLAIWGERRMTAPLDGRPLRVAAIQNESYDLDKLANLSLSAAGTQLIVWPEYSFTVAPGAEEAFRKLLAKKLAGPAAVAVLPGAIFPEDMKTGFEQNFAWVVAPGGALLGRYDKAHPIPFVETRLPANKTPRPVDTPVGRLGVEICYDLDFADTTRSLARQGAELLIVPDLDPLEWGAWQHRQHSAMSAARAAESGLWIVRAASSGESQLVDPAGRVAAFLPSGAQTALPGDVRLRGAATAYTRLGWLLAPLCLFLTIGLAAYCLRPSR